MDVFCDDYHQYWETNMFFHSEELDSDWNNNSWGVEEATYYDSSSPDGPASSLASKNIVSERNRRRKLNDRLFALRAVVPNISKMDKASIIKDAIDYIKELHEQERRIRAEISELEIRSSNNNGCESSAMVVDQEFPFAAVLRSKKKKTMDYPRQLFDSDAFRRSSPPIEDLEMRVSYVGERTVVVSLTCGKREGTVVKLCEIFESLKLKIITAHITVFSGRILKTVFVEADEREKDYLRIKIETVISSSQ